MSARQRGGFAAALYVREDADTGKLFTDHSIADYFFMQFMWAIVDYPSLELGFESPHAGLRHIGGAILMLFFALAVAVIGNKIFIAMMTSTYQEMKVAAELNFKFRRVNRVVYYASAPREPSVFFVFECIAILIGRALHWLLLIDFSPDGGWRDRGAFRWELDGFRPPRGALERARSAADRSRAMLLGEMQATVDAANEAVRRMSGSQREREARPSSETVHHIVKSEVSTANAKINERIDALEAGVNERINTLEAGVNERINALEAGVNAKLDKCISAINMLSRERQPTGRLEA